MGDSDGASLPWDSDLAELRTTALNMPELEELTSACKRIADERIMFLPPDIATAQSEFQHLSNFLNNESVSEVPHLPLVYERIKFVLQWFEVAKPQDKPRKRTKRVPKYHIFVIHASKPEKRRTLKNRVTIEQAFRSELAGQMNEHGQYYFLVAEAEDVAERVFNRRVKIGGAGRPNEGLTGDRSPYARLHDALAHAKWKKDIVGAFYVYWKE